MLYFDNSDTIAYVDEEHIDTETYKQILNLNINPTVTHCRIMPDCHAGTGCIVGFTSHFTDKVIPQIIGCDIGCGMLVYPLNETKDRRKFKDGKYEKKFDSIIQQIIPIGPKIHDSAVVALDEYTDFLNECKNEANLFAERYKLKFKLKLNIDISSKIPKYDTDWLKSLCKKIGLDFDLMLRYMCTLGGGNHFIEIDEDEQNDILYLTVHTGSRIVGKEICAFHQSKITKDNKFLVGDDAFEYYFDMIFAQKYAMMNRLSIVSNIINNLGLQFDKSKAIESVHNYIDFDDMIVRKGAIRAHKNQKCIIALNMRDGILICEGKGNEEWNYSCAHGSGRIVSRSKAKSKFSMKQYMQDMKDVYST